MFVIVDDDDTMREKTLLVLKDRLVFKMEEPLERQRLLRVFSRRHNLA